MARPIPRPRAASVGVHRPDLRVLRVELPNGPDPQQAAVLPEAEERDRWVEQPGRIEREGMPGHCACGEDGEG